MIAWDFYGWGLNQFLLEWAKFAELWWWFFADGLM
jgi:hypothetical protein